MRINMPTDEWVRSYCGFIVHHLDSDSWLLSFWGYPITTGTEDHCSHVLAELAAELAAVIDRRDNARGVR